MAFSLHVSILAADGDRVPFHADPVLAAIERHSKAWAVFQAAPEGEASERADDEAFAALDALLGTACATRAGALCLIRHLRWWLMEEASSACAYGPSWAIARAREADLSMMLGVERIERLPVALPSGRLLAPPVEPRSPGALSLSRGAPFQTLDRVGEAAAAFVIVIGGGVLVGFASLL